MMEGDSDNEANETVLRTKAILTRLEGSRTDISYETYDQQTGQYELSDQEEQIIMEKKTIEYLETKLARKLEAERRKKEQFGQSSSSDDEDIPNNSRDDNRSEQSNQLYLTTDSLTRQEETLFLPSRIRVPSVQLKEKAINQESWNIKVCLRSQQFEPAAVALNETTISINASPMLYSAMTKLKIYLEKSRTDPHRLKITFDNDEMVFLLPLNDSHRSLFFNLLYYRLKLCQCEKVPAQDFALPKQGLPAGTILYGMIPKKAQILTRWPKRLVVVTKQGISSYKNPNDKPSMFIPANSISQLWTRFEVYEKSYLVIKIMYNSTKTEFAVPLGGRWIQTFYELTWGRKA